MNWLWQTQLSNVEKKTNKNVLECDSGFQIVTGRIRQMMVDFPDIHHTVLVPPVERCITPPRQVYPDIGDKIKFVHIDTPVSAIETRFHFDFGGIAAALNLGNTQYDVVYVNDPCLVPNFTALFRMRSDKDKQPIVVAHNHFWDLPLHPKFKDLGISIFDQQVVGAAAADVVVHNCSSMIEQSLPEVKERFPNLVDRIFSKDRSLIWDGGYSQAEITRPFKSNLQLNFPGKVVIFFPSRISPASGDFTYGERFFFGGVLQQLWSQRPNEFVVLAGNPNLKHPNSELLEKCGPFGYVCPQGNTTLSRDDFKAMARASDISLHLYAADSDPHGGTVMRECTELGTWPLMPNCNEYGLLAGGAGYPWTCHSDLSNFVTRLCQMIGMVQKEKEHPMLGQQLINLRKEVKQRCSFEATTKHAVERILRHVR